MSRVRTRPSYSTPPPRDRTLVASGLGIAGGLFALRDGAWHRIDDASATGLAVSDDGALLARLAWREADPAGSGELVLYDGDGPLLRKRVDELRECPARRSSRSSTCPPTSWAR